MKEMSKVKIYLKKSISSILSEKQILTTLHYSLIANLYFSFQDKEYLYLILDYLPGGDLRYYMDRKMIFNEMQIKFFISNLILSLRYVHNNNILHRDIKPENLVFDDKGYLHLTDFGISRKIKKGREILSKSGTPSYMSPEVLLNKPQKFYSDFFSVGVICYELLMGKKPFKGNNKKKITEKILYKIIKLTKKNIPKNYSITMGDFINKLLRRNPEERLGNKNIEEIINHPWLEGVDWGIIESKLYDSNDIPFIPNFGDNFDSYIANKKDNVNVENYEVYLKRINDLGYFNNYYFNYYNLISITKFKVIYEKTSFGHKYAAPTEGIKTSPNQSKVELENNYISGEKNNNIVINITKELYNFKIDKNKNNIENESKIPRKSKTIFKRTNRVLRRRIISYENRQINENKKDKSFEDYDEDDKNTNDDYKDNFY